MGGIDEAMSAPKLKANPNLLQGEQAEAFKSANLALKDQLTGDVAKTAQGGSERSRERHVSRGKLLPRDRVRHLIDPGTPFLELSQLAANGLYGEDIPGAGIITGIGQENK